MLTREPRQKFKVPTIAWEKSASCQLSVIKLQSYRLSERLSSTYVLGLGSSLRGAWVSFIMSFIMIKVYTEMLIPVRTAVWLASLDNNSIERQIPPDLSGSLRILTDPRGSLRIPPDPSGSIRIHQDPDGLHRDCIGIASGPKLHKSLRTPNQSC